MERTTTRFLLSLMLAGCFAGTAPAQEREQPDFTGVWKSYRGARSEDGDDAPTGRLLPEAQAKVDTYQALTSATRDRPGLYCLGKGMPASMLGAGGAGYPMEIIQRPEQMTVIFEDQNEIRRIYFGDRILPFEDRLDERNGYSAGRWEGDTLVIETTHLREQVDQRYAHSDQATIVERYTLSHDENGIDILTMEMTMTDPLFYTGPVSATHRVQRDPDGVMLTYECAESRWLDHLDDLYRSAENN